MYCELKDKDIELVEVKRVKAGDNELVFRQCTGMYFYIGNQRMIKSCDKSNDEKCLFRQKGTRP